MHLLDRIERCHNPEVATHLLEGKVMEMIRDTMLVPEKLRACMEGAQRANGGRHENLVRKLERFTDRIAAIEGQKQRTIELYAAGALTKDAYTAENLTLDRELQRLQRRKMEIAREVQAAGANDMVEHSIRDHSERAKARLERCSTFDLTRQFLLDHIQRIVYLREKVTTLGSVPVKRSPSEAAVSLPFRIDGELDRKAIRAKPHKVLPDDGRWKKLKETVTEDVPVGVKKAVLSAIC